MKRRWIAGVAAVVLLLGLTGCGKKDQQEEAQPVGTAVEVMTVERGDIATENTVTGMVSASRSIPVMSPISCKVKAVKVQAGDSVAEGDALFVLDTADVRKLYGTVLDTYSSTETLLDEQIRQTRENLQNMQALYEMGAVSRSAVDQVSLALMQAESSKESTLAQLGIKDVKDALEDPVIRAPIAGTVTNVGVTAGVPVSNTNPAIVVSEVGKPQVIVNVSESLQPFLHVGDGVSVEIPSIREEPFTGKVASVASAISQTTALYEVRIDLKDVSEVAIGMFARAVFRTDSRADAVLVPSEAIMTSEDEQYVYVVEEDKAYRVVVSTGLIGETQTEIVTGLSGGEQLVTRGQSYLSDGAPIRITGGESE